MEQVSLETRTEKDDEVVAEEEEEAAAEEEVAEAEEAEVEAEVEEASNFVASPHSPFHASSIPPRSLPPSWDYAVQSIRYDALDASNPNSSIRIASVESSLGLPHLLLDIVVVPVLVLLRL